MLTKDNLITKDFIMDDNNHYLEENVTIQNWARNRRQKILMNTSFESDVFNIYNPYFSSQESGVNRSLS